MLPVVVVSVAALAAIACVAIYAMKLVAVAHKIEPPKVINHVAVPRPRRAPEERWDDETPAPITEDSEIAAERAERLAQVDEMLAERGLL